MRYIGIDPGKTGAIAIQDETDIQVYDYGDYALYDKLRQFYSEILFAPVTAVIEKVSPMPGEGSVSSFTFGKNVGGWLTLCEFLKFRVIEPTPAKWQKVIFADMPIIYTSKNVPVKRKEGTKLVKVRNPPGSKNKWKTEAKRVKDTKAMSKAAAMRLFPTVAQKYLKLKKHHGRSDAILLMEYGRRFDK